MKNFLNNHRLPCLIFDCGCAGAALRLWMYAGAVDEKGLLILWNLPYILTLLLSAAVAAAVCLSVRKLDGSNRYAANFPPSLAGGLSNLAMGVGIASLILQRLPETVHHLDALWLVLAAISLPCLAVAGYFRVQGKRPPFYLHSMLCLFLVIHLVNEYRLWSGNPQYMAYFFQVFACVGLTLSAYYRAAFDVGMGRRRMQLGSNLLTAYFCLVSLTESGYGLFYAGGAAWCLTNLCVWEPPQRRRREVQPE